MKIQPFLHEIWTHIYIVTIGNDQILIPHIALSIESSTLSAIGYPLKVR